MGTIKPIPAIDLLDGKVVRLMQGDYNKVKHYDINLYRTIEQWCLEGVRTIHLVDLDGARTGIVSTNNRKIFEKIARAFPDLTVQVGGGIRGAMQALIYLEAGISHLVLGSLLIKNIELSKEVISSFPDKIYLGLDLRNNKLTTQGWRADHDLTASTLINDLSDVPYLGIISTDVNRDGMLSGVNAKALKEIAQLTTKPCIASGGFKSTEDVQALMDLSQPNITGVIVGRSLLEGTFTLKDFFKVANATD